MGIWKKMWVGVFFLNTVYKYYVGLNIAYKQYDRIIMRFNVLLQLINI